MPQNDEMTDEERHMLELVRQVENKVDNSSLGGITIDTPEAYFRAMCYLISYNSGTPYHIVKELSLFDFVIMMVMMEEMNKDTGEGGSPTPGAMPPRDKSLARMM